MFVGVILVIFMIFATTIAGVKRNLKSLAGKNDPKPRDLPSDREILETFLQIEDPVARRFFAIMAVFGLRNHEVPISDLAPLLQGEYYLLVPEETKTGVREAWALYPEWVDLFGLREAHAPFVLPANPTTQTLGKLVGKTLKDAKIPFTPYNLRHCWARRSISQLDPRLAAASLGHSLDEHYKTYNCWFTFHDTKQAYQRLLDDPNRIRPPEIS